MREAGRESELGGTPPLTPTLSPVGEKEVRTEKAGLLHTLFRGR